MCSCWCADKQQLIKMHGVNIQILQNVLFIPAQSVSCLVIGSSVPYRWHVQHNSHVCKQTGTLKFTLKQLLRVSFQSPSSGSVLFELAKVIFIKIIS
jgi:hypothetical protein